MTKLIGTYKYMYGAGTRLNREIRFFRRKKKKETFRAEVYAIVLGKPEKTSDLEGSQISVEMMSTSEKIALLDIRKRGEPVEKKSNKLMSELECTEQDRIIKELQPDGPRRIEITNDFGPDSRLERVVHLSIFNPS